jgi:hypothetical protein
MIRLLIVVIVLGIGQRSFSESHTQDPYDEALVTSFVCPPGTFIIYSMQEKAVNRLGDRAAIGLIRYLGTRDPSTSKEVERILGVIKMAYAEPEAINSDGDREPKATLLLLAYLNYLPVSKKMSPALKQTRMYVLHQIEEYKRKQAKK